MIYSQATAPSSIAAPASTKVKLLIISAITTVIWVNLALHPVGAKIGEKPNPYEKIEQQSQAVAILQQVRSELAKRFGLIIRLPVDIHLVHEKELDKRMHNSPYRGAETGLYAGIYKGRHQIYVMKGWSRDRCSGITAHELTHAWQAENVSPDQELVLKEGLANWIEYKYLDSIGAYALALKLRNTADPVYGVGLKAMLALEEKIGAENILNKIRSVKSLKELKIW